ncbi:hypothetical protein E1295_00305 [Nonomuraea mesophila]|uniref:Uncharacterized protein n=1 Tax=Nonomuraea mesophila TaxID=2530382 RepID=A0A4R5FXT8_9ACTN|nr:hypothetical protein [Nonomuraea mesophila]TDE60324.1 hypothetical protein E1295_00305 [Nonomuraea mesophila]
MFRAARSSRWTDRHTLAVAGGAIVAHSIGGVPMTAFVERQLVDRLALAVMAVLAAILIAYLDRRLRAAPTTRDDHEPMHGRKR